MVPPHRRVEEGVARLELSYFGGRDGILKTRIAIEIRLAEIDHAHDLAARCQVKRSRIEICNLLRRKQREPPAADQRTGDVVREVEVGGGYRAIAHPYA